MKDAEPPLTPDEALDVLDQFLIGWRAPDCDDASCAV